MMYRIKNKKNTVNESIKSQFNNDSIDNQDYSYFVRIMKT